MTDEKVLEQKFADAANFAMRSVKAEMLDELEDYDWIQRMRLKCRTYIKTNGTKTTTVDEIVDFLRDDALKSFPMNVREKCHDRLQEILVDIGFL